MSLFLAFLGGVNAEEVALMLIPTGITPVTNGNPKLLFFILKEEQDDGTFVAYSRYRGDAKYITSHWMYSFYYIESKFPNHIEMVERIEAPAINPTQCSWTRINRYSDDHTIIHLNEYRDYKGDWKWYPYHSLSLLSL